MNKQPKKTNDESSNNKDYFGSIKASVFFEKSKMKSVKQLAEEKKNKELGY